MKPLKSQHPPRRNVELICPEISRTDQEQAQDLSMKSIKLKLERQIPIKSARDIFYSTDVPKFNNLQDALEFSQNMENLFHQLPVDIRQEMGHDIKQLNSYFTDPKNEQTLKKHGLITTQRDGVTEIIEAIKASKPDLNASPDPKKPL